MFIPIDTGESINGRFVVSISDFDTPSEDGTRQWRQIIYLVGSEVRTAHCLAEHAEAFLAAVTADI